MKAAVLIKKLLGLSTVTRARCGFLVALVLIISIGVREAVRNVEVLNRNEMAVCIVVGLIGFLSWLVGGLGEIRRAEAEADLAASGAPAPVEDPLGFLKSFKYWGLIFLLSAGILSALAIWHRPRPALVARARPLPVVSVTLTNIVTITNEVPRTIEAPRMPFPRLVLQGLVVNGTRSSAVINGRVLCLGEGVSNVVLVAVDSEHAAVLFAGQTNVLTLRK